MAIFRHSGIPGDTLICREMLSEGKVKYTREISVFFESRAKHLEYQYGIDKQTYYTNVVQETELLREVARYDEVVLWFEFDLFCQINMLFILHYLYSEVKNPPAISLVSLDHHPDIPNFRGLGMLRPDHLPPLFEQRVALTPDDIQFAEDAWDAYCMNTPLALETLSQLPPGNLRYLPAAIRAHLQRLPNVENGLNVIEQFFLQRLSLGKYRWYDLYTLFWNELSIFGFGDFQLDIYAQRMRSSGVIEQENQLLTITRLGREILDNEENYTDYVALEHRWLGGIRMQHSPWRWDPELQRVVQVSVKNRSQKEGT